MPSKDEILEFSNMIQGLSSELRCGIMEAVIHHCETSGMEIEVAGSLLSSAMKSVIREEAQELNMIKRNSKLPL